MDARYARGRSALVERRDRFYGLGNPRAGHLAPLFPKTQFLKSTKRVSQGLFRWLTQASVTRSLASYIYLES